ncbi:MAG: FtsL-like putative cell division protein [Mucilaginibacter sp.]|uniref:FtsL-like putative cell division protein n=1 Tax=Mucilaginibacter sp. TaxID=1882438 RepID=UPI0032637D5F
MNNRLRAEIAEEEEEKELIVEKKAPKEFSENYFTQLFSKGFMSTESATKALPFILYVAFLGMLYIANRHLSEKNLRTIDKLTKEVKELNWDYKSTKADLAYKSTLTEVAKRVDTLGIKISVEPPQKLTIESDSK